jgi:Flp pilus assembly protein TadG
MLFGLLLGAVHTMLALQTRTLVNAAAWDAARAVASDPTAADASGIATRRVNAVIPRLSPATSARVTNDAVTVTVTATSPGLFPGVTSLDDFRKVTRRVTIRRELLR